jgi:hypothetical protein
VTYLSKVIVNSYISNTSVYSYTGPTNTTITTDNLNAIFDFPRSVTSSGRKLYTSSDPTKYSNILVYLIKHHVDLITILIQEY